MPRYTALHAIAEYALKHFETVQRTTDGESQTIVKLKESAPEWLRDAVREAHGDMLPDDYKFSMAQEACETIAEVGEFSDMDEIAQEFAERPTRTHRTCSTGWGQATCASATATRLSATTGPPAPT
jgi:hypothetical protein